MGRAMAQRLAAHGCPLALADWDGDGLRDTAASVETPVLTRQLDVRDREAQADFAAEVAAWATAPLGMVFNNAGVSVLQAVDGANVEDDDWVMGINFHGVVNGVRAFLPLLLHQGEGVIVNTSSVYAFMAMPYYSAYSASKFAVRGFTDSLRLELRGTGVRAVTVFPGGVRTGIVRSARLRPPPDGAEVSSEERIRRIEDRARTTPERAAEIIHEGVNAGHARILVGGDARVFELLSRLSPVRYLEILESAGSGLRRLHR